MKRTENAAKNSTESKMTDGEHDTESPSHRRAEKRNVQRLQCKHECEEENEFARSKMENGIREQNMKAKQGPHFVCAARYETRDE